MHKHSHDTRVSEFKLTSFNNDVFSLSIAQALTKTKRNKLIIQFIKKNVYQNQNKKSPARVRQHFVISFKHAKSLPKHTSCAVSFHFVHHILFPFTIGEQTARLSRGSD